MAGDGMRDLMKDQPVFREVLHSFDRAIQTLTDWSILEQMTAGT